MYSQNNEEQIIFSYFKDFKGNLLSLGENDGETLSNCRALLLNGWTGVLVEPSEKVFPKLRELYRDTSVQCIQVAIGNKSGKATFYDSDTLLKIGDKALVSTMSIDETRRWGNSVAFDETEVDVITMAELLKMTLLKTFDFISIDCEGYDLDILKQIDLKALQTKLICIEFNGKDQYLYDREVLPLGFKLIHKNAENLIYGL